MTANPKSRTAQAIAWMAAQPGRTSYAAAKHFALSPSAVHEGLKRAADKRCPCCGQRVTARTDPDQSA